MDMEQLIPKLSGDAVRYADRISDVYDVSYARLMGFEIDTIDTENVSLYLDIRPEHINSRGYVHGAVIYGLIDHTLAFAANMTEESVGQNVSIIYHRPMREGRLITKSRLINTSRSLKVYEICAYCDGKLIASAICTAFRLGDAK